MNVFSEVLSAAINQRVIDTSITRVSREPDCGKAEAPDIPRSLFFNKFLKCRRSNS